MREGDRGDRDADGDVIGDAICTAEVLTLPDGDVKTTHDRQDE